MSTMSEPGMGPGEYVYMALCAPVLDYSWIWPRITYDLARPALRPTSSKTGGHFRTMDKASLVPCLSRAWDPASEGIPRDRVISVK